MAPALSYWQPLISTENHRSSWLKFNCNATKLRWSKSNWSCAGKACSTYASLKRPSKKLRAWVCLKLFSSIYPGLWAYCKQMGGYCKQPRLLRKQSRLFRKQRAGLRKQTRLSRKQPRYPQKFIAFIKLKIEKIEIKQKKERNPRASLLFYCNQVGSASNESSLISPTISSKMSSIVTSPDITPSFVVMIAICVRLCCILVNTV